MKELHGEANRSLQLQRSHGNGRAARRRGSSVWPAGQRGRGLGAVGPTQPEEPQGRGTKGNAVPRPWDVKGSDRCTGSPKEGVGGEQTLELETQQQERRRGTPAPPDRPVSPRHKNQQKQQRRPHTKTTDLLRRQTRKPSATRQPTESSNAEGVTHQDNGGRNPRCEAGPAWGLSVTLVPSPGCFRTAPWKCAQQSPAPREG